MKNRNIRFHIGLRTIKTTIAVILSMIIVDTYGTSGSRLIYAMLGAMAAVMPTFKESLESCISQIVGVIFGALVAVLLDALPLSPLAATGIGIVLIITLYNTLGIRFSPSLPCFILVSVCTSADVQPISYAVGRIWDSAIGLGVGMLINTLVFPYDNSKRILFAVRTLDKELIRFLEDMFDGDDNLPKADRMEKQLKDIERQLTVFANQKLFLQRKQQREELERFRRCESKARILIARMEVLSRVERPGRLDEENRRSLEECGAVIRDERPLELLQELDVVTNYHVRQILLLRKELLDTLEPKVNKKEISK